ncbi:MAG: permease, partial [Gemmataceae bacterium]
ARLLPDRNGHARWQTIARLCQGWAVWRYIVLLLPILLYFLALSNPVFDQEPTLITKPFSEEPLPYITSFIIIFRSILWEALPFIILGALIAGLLDELLPQRWLTAIIPRNPFLAVGIGGLLGLVFPICECGIVPIMRRLLRKGLPLSACVAYLLAGPIVNPVVIGSTFAAFNGMENTFIGGKPAYQMSDWWMVLFRTGMGYLVAFSTAMLVEVFWRRFGVELLTPLTRPSQLPEAETEVGPRRTVWQRVSNISATSLHDFVDITVFLIIGAILAAGTRMFLTPETIADLGTQHMMLTILLMMGLAIILCLCSEADAFVAASFVTLPPAAKVSFLVLGPMVDIKLYALYLLIFRPRLIALIYFSVITQVFVYSVATHSFWETYKEQLVTPKMPEAEKLSETDIIEQAARSSFALTAMGTAVDPTTWATATARLVLDPEEKSTEMRFLALESAAEKPALRAFYQGRLVWMSGRFSGSERGFVLIRYKYNCCAADAVPLKAYLVPKDPLLNVPADDYQGRWVKVTGRVDFRLERGHYVPYIVLTPPDKRSWDRIIQIIEQPSNPYIY